MAEWESHEGQQGQVQSPARGSGQFPVSQIEKVLDQTATFYLGHCMVFHVPSTSMSSFFPLRLCLLLRPDQFKH